MAARFESVLSTGIVRPALMEGNKAGKMPVPVGRWVWPIAAVTLALTTFWGARHIEQQIDIAAPESLAKAGVDIMQLEFNTDYRSVEVTGVIPENTDSHRIQSILANYVGPQGENIRYAEVSRAATPAVVLETDYTSYTDNPLLSVDVSANVEHGKIVLTGKVPTAANAALLYEAALRSYQPENIDNYLIVSNKPASIDNADQYINELATVISNFDNNILDAHIDLDDDLMTGNITAADRATTNKAIAFLPTTLVNVNTNNDTLLKPLATSTAAIETAENQVQLLQNDIDQLADEILAKITFASGSNIMATEATVVLDELITALYSYPNTAIEIGGHTDSLSSATYNLNLSQERADSVANYLISAGIDSSRLLATGFGESQPIAPNNTENGRARNRRVEFRAY